MDTPRLKELAPQIADALGQEWTYTPTRHDNDYTTHNITHTSGSAIHLFHDTYRKKLTISGNFPKSDHDNTRFGPYGENKNKYSIGVNPEREAQAIAKDIKRRLLPHYVLEYPQALTRRDEYDARHERKTQICQELAHILGITPTHEQQCYLSGNIVHYGSFRVEGIDSIRFERLTLTYEQALIVVDALAESAKETRLDSQSLF